MNAESPLRAQAAVIVVGTELTQGFTRESNSVFLGRWLSERGFMVVSAQKVPDDIGLIAGAVKATAAIADVLILTGGLGSTHDDVTRDALAQALGVPLIQDDGALKSIERQIPVRADRGAFLRQAYLPQGARPILPPAGTAPGIVAQLEDAVIFALPGVPREMEKMLDFVDFELHARKKIDSTPQVRRIRMAGRSEPELAQLIAPVLSAHPEIIVNILAKPEEISVTLLSYESVAPGDEFEIDRALGEIRAVLGGLIFSEQDEDLAQIVGRLLLDRRMSMGVAESITAGQIGSLMAGVPGASRYFKGGVIAYDNGVKTSLLGVSDQVLERCGAVSAETAEAMAAGARRALACDIGVAVTGIAGPDGATSDKPVGLVYTSICAGGSTLTTRSIYTGNREMIQRKTAYRALDLLRHYLLGVTG